MPFPLPLFTHSFLPLLVWLTFGTINFIVHLFAAFADRIALALLHSDCDCDFALAHKLLLLLLLFKLLFFLLFLLFLLLLLALSVRVVVRLWAGERRDRCNCELELLRPGQTHTRATPTGHSLSACQSVCLSACLFVYLFICPFVSSTVCLLI